MSLTKRTEKKISDIVESTGQPEEVLNFLNAAEHLCTPGLLLRRQLQEHFPHLVDAEALSREKFKRCSVKISPEHWKKYLNDEQRCTRDIAIKLAFALKMNESAAEKFLLAHGYAPLSLRNPFDFACAICLKHGFTFEEAESLYKDFCVQCPAPSTESIGKISDNDFTRQIKVETNKVLQGDKISFEKKAPQLLDTMKKHAGDFCYSGPGFSVSNMARLKVMLKFLKILYPTFEYCFRGMFYPEKEIAVKEDDGTPKVPQHLVDAMLQSQKIYRESDLPEYCDLTDLNGPDLSEPRGQINRLYQNIPFTRGVLIPLRRLSKTLRAVLRSVDAPDNARSVDRDTALVLSYFMISGWLAAAQKTKENFWNTLQEDKSTAKEDSPEEILLLTLNELLESLDSIDDNPEPREKIYKQMLDLILQGFELKEFYAPFVLDRFILLCLVSEKQNLMLQVILASYPTAKKILEVAPINDKTQID